MDIIIYIGYYLVTGSILFSLMVMYSLHVHNTTSDEKTRYAVSYILQELHGAYFPIAVNIAMFWVVLLPVAVFSNFDE